MADFLFGSRQQCLAKKKAVFEFLKGFEGRKMKRRKGQAPQGYSGPLWDDPQPHVDEIKALQELLGSSSKNSDQFHQDWVNPLLAEGLSIGRVLDLLISGTVRPN